MTSELRAVVLALEHFSYYVKGREVRVYTDHNNLRFTVNAQTDDKALLRLLLRLMSYRITMIHVPGIKNLFADFLSRKPLVYLTVNGT